MTSATCCARSAAISSASVAGAIADTPGSSTSSRMRFPMSVPPGSRVSTAPRWAASCAAWVDLPDASPPSKTMRRPLGMNFVAAQHPFGQQAGADDDHAAQPECDADTRQLDGDSADGYRAGRCLVDGEGEERADSEGDDQTEADDRVQRGEHATADLVGHVLLDEREPHD